MPAGVGDLAHGQHRCLGKIVAGRGRKIDPSDERLNVLRGDADRLPANRMPAGDPEPVRSDDDHRAKAVDHRAQLVGEQFRVRLRVADRPGSPPESSADAIKVTLTG